MPAWAEALEFKYCHGGSGGATILRLPFGALCIKMADWSPAEVFAQRLAAAFNVRVAACRVVHAGVEEGAAIKRALHSAESARPDDKLILYELRKIYSIVVLEYINGVVMMGMPAHEHLESLREREDGAIETFRLIGRLMAFDTLINNFDRLPLVWSNDGNLGNIMLGSSQGAVVGIDQMVAPIKNQVGLSAYLDRVRNVVAEAKDARGHGFGAVKTAICNNTGCELSDHELGCLQSGCLEFFSQVRDMLASGEFEKRLEVVSAELSDLCKCARPLLDEKGLTESSDPTSGYCSLVREVSAVIRDTLEGATAE